MAIYDCFQYFNEDHILELRFNILNEHVDYFVISESTKTHQGTEKKLNFNINNFSKFKHKIIYIVADYSQKINFKNHTGGESLVEQHQRNSLSDGLINADDNDLIVLSDSDEIPDLTKLNQLKKNTKFAAFSQMMFMYKLNLKNVNESNWVGSRLALKKNFPIPQKLRNMKFKEYPFWRADTYFAKNKSMNSHIVKNGGWHFTNIKTAEDLYEKFKNFGHHNEFEDSGMTLETIKEQIINREVKYNHYADKTVHDKHSFSYKLKKTNTEILPEYLQINSAKYKKWFS